MSGGGTGAETAPIRPEEAFDEPRVARYLAEHLPELVSSDVRFDQFPGGKANLTYRAVSDGRELVLRRAPLGSVAEGGHDMEREYRVLSRLWKAYPLAPRAYHYCPDPSVMGKPFFVMERRFGYVVRDSWPPSWPEGDHAVRRRASESLVDALAALHRVDPGAVGLEDLGRPEGFVRRQIDGWSRRWAAARTRRVPAMAEIEGVLRPRIPRPQAAAILHNDFKFDNVMVDEHGDVVAVFDWDMATLGDPLVDVGTLLAYWVEPSSPLRSVLSEQAITPEPFVSRAEALERYAAGTGLDLSDIGFYEGLALYRLAVIIEQIYARYAAGQTSDERFAEFEDMAPVLAAAALAALSA